MACGLPVVLYDLPEGRQSASDGGLYANGNDPIDFAEQIAKLLDSDSLRRRLGKFGKDRIRNFMNWETEKEMLLSAYATALRGSPSLMEDPLVNVCVPNRLLPSDCGLGGKQPSNRHDESLDRRAHERE